MPVLQPSQYNQAYFKGRLVEYPHTAGYTDYDRVNYNRIAIGYLGLTEEESTGTPFGDLIKAINIRNNLAGSSIMELGCAYGYLVAEGRKQGLEMYGIDVSQWAYDQADPVYAQPYMTVGDARTIINTWRNNQYDFVISRWFLECMSDTDINGFINKLNRGTKVKQIHIINPTVRADYYNQKTLQQWVDKFDWDAGTIFIANNDIDNYITKVG